MKKLMIEYDLYGLVLPDMKVLRWAEKLAEKFNKGTDSFLVSVSSGFMLDAISLMISRDILNHEEVVFKYEDIMLQPDPSGKTKWPAGSHNYYGDLLEELLYF